LLVAYRKWLIFDGWAEAKRLWIYFRICSDMIRICLGYADMI